MRYCFNVCRETFGVTDVAHMRFRSYLSGRTQYVRCGSSRSSTTYLVYGVPQGSVLGPLLFVLYTVNLVSLIERHSLSPHLYADDTQVYGSCSPAAVHALSVTISECSANLRLTTLRPCVRRADQPTLAAHSAAHPV